MSQPQDEIPDGLQSPETALGEDRRRARIFMDWCIRREAAIFWNGLTLVIPLVIFRYFTSDIFGFGGVPSVRMLMSTLLWVAAIFILFGGGRHAASAVCWEVSSDLKDLVRLTGINPRTLLWCKSLARWWTIGLSILVMLPWVMFIRTMGTVGADFWIAGSCWLLMLAALTAGFAMIASVSSSQAANPETNAATATFLLLVVYNLAFLGIAACLGVLFWMIHGDYLIPPSSGWRQAIQFVLGLAPVGGVYSAFNSPELFSPLSPSFWLHGLIAGFCCWAASVVIRNRFRVTTRGDAFVNQASENRSVVKAGGSLRPRCSDRPFFWKDTYILGGGAATRARWFGISILSTVAIVTANIYELPLVAGVMTACIAPALVAIRFDALLAPEFRDQTWGSLMLLPVEPRFLLLEKVRAAARERISLLIPFGIAAAFAIPNNALAWFMTTVIALMASVLMVEVSVLNQFYSKNGLVTMSIAIGIILAIFLMIPPWAFLNPWVSLGWTLFIMICMGAILALMIERRLRNWTDQ